MTCLVLHCKAAKTEIAAWALFAVVAVALAATWVILARGYWKWRALKREVEKGELSCIGQKNMVKSVKLTH